MIRFRDKARNTLYEMEVGVFACLSLVCLVFLSSTMFLPRTVVSSSPPF